MAKEQVSKAAAELTQLQAQVSQLLQQNAHLASQVTAAADTGGSAKADMQHGEVDLAAGSPRIKAAPASTVSTAQQEPCKVSLSQQPERSS